MRAVFGRKGSPDVFSYAFDVLEMDGHDLGAQSWDTRRALLTQLLDRCQDGLRLSEHVEDTDGAVVFRNHGPPFARALLFIAACARS